MQFTDQLSDAIKGSKSRAFLSDGTDDVLIDVVLSDAESDTMQVTRHAIEEGSDISDHVIENPKDFSVEAVLTDDDLDIMNPNSLVNKSVQERLRIIQKWIDNKTVLTYYGHDKDFESVVLQNVGRLKTQDTGEGIKIMLSLSKINIAKSQISLVNVTMAKGKTAKQKNSKAGDKTQNKSWIKTLMQ